MNVFISWSGDVSKSVGEILHKYLPTILQGVNVFLSSHDIDAGAKWAKVLSEQLECTNFGILCLTPYNLDSKWLIFEAGALSKLSDSSVCCLLINGINPTDVEPPLSQFQNKRFNVNDIKSLLITINKLRNKPLEIDQLNLLFDSFWPKIEAEYNSALSLTDFKGKTKRKRTESELLEEILFKVRGIENQISNYQPSANIGQEELFEMPINSYSVREYCKRKFPDMDISQQWENRLLKDLNTQRYQHIRDLDAVVTRALPAMKAYAKESQTAFTHSTDYLTKAFGFTDIEFREIHPWCELTLNAFDKYKHLIKDV